jgi:IS6 family transposase
MSREQLCLSSLSYDSEQLGEQDHRFVKRLTKPEMGFFSFETAWRTLHGFEVMNMIRKGQLQGVAKRDIVGQVALVAKPFGVAI